MVSAWNLERRMMFKRERVRREGENNEKEELKMCCFYRHYPVLPKSHPEDTRFFVCHVKKLCDACEALRQSKFD